MVEGRRGQQKTRWMDGVKEATNKSIEELKEMAQKQMEVIHQKGQQGSDMTEYTLLEEE